jgi:pimeloyl-ACP methyl ester carboxylesterase
MRSLLVVLIAMCAACTHPQPQPSVDAGAPAVTAASVDAGRMLEGVPWQIDIEENGKKLGSISIPLGAREPRPILVALHGASDKPGWACGEWRAIVDAYPFVVCPRGEGTESSLYWPSPAKTLAAIDALLDVTRAKFGDWLASGPTVLAGFSMGASQAAILSREDPKRFPRVVLAESSFDPKGTAVFASSYKGERVALLCTTLGCGPVYRQAGETLARRGVPSRVNISGTNAHGMWEVTNASMRRDWPWVVEGVPGWESYLSYRGKQNEHDGAAPGKTIAFDPR